MSKERVVCIDGDFVISKEGDKNHGMPIKGEIYTVKLLVEIGGNDYYILHELGFAGFRTNAFRPFDDSFGEWIESTVMKEVEFEGALKLIEA